MTGPTTGPSLHRLTVLFDPGCALCRGFRDWLARQPVLVPLDLVPADSPEAWRRFPTLDHRATMQRITVVGDKGQIWTEEHAFVLCLWATASHRALAERLARPAWLPLARAAALTAAGIRTHTRSAHTGDYIDGCGALPQG